MFLRKIEYKNIGSFGNKLVEIEFEQKGTLIRLTGESGSGKSTILSIPSLIFYGKTQGVNKSDIANRINKNGFVKGEIISGKDLFVIERTFSPNTLRIWKNGEDQDVVGIEDGQNYIEKNIMPIPYSVFSNIISLDLSTFKSFTTLSPAEKKKIIDNIFNFGVINRAHEFVKEEIKERHKSAEKNIAVIENLKDQQSSVLSKIQTIKEKYKTEYTQRLNEVSEQLESEKKELASAKSKYETDITQNELIILDKQNTLNTNDMVYRRNLQDVNRKIELYQQNKCPTCGVSFQSENFKQLLNQLEEVRKQYEGDVQSNMKEFQRFQTFYNKFMEIKQQSLHECKIHDSNVTILQREADELKRQIDNQKNTPHEITELVKFYKECSDRITELVDRNNKLNIEIEYLSVIEALLGDNGIKRELMRSYTPFINQNLKDILSKVKFPYTLEFDETFSPILYDLGDSIKVSTLSLGETKRANLAIVAVLLMFIKQKYPQLSFVALDEVTSSLDVVNAEEAMKFLSELADKLNMTIVVVSHTMSNNSDYIVKTMTVEKVSRFAELRTEVLASA